MKTEALVVNGKEIKFEIVEDKKAMVSSREIAEHFGKRHANVIRAIENSSKYEEFLREGKIKISEYKVEGNNKSYKMYLLDRDTFTFYVMSFTGEKADNWKLDYIDAFNQMKERLRKQNPAVPMTYIEALEKHLESEKARRTNQKLEQKKTKEQK